MKRCTQKSVSISPHDGVGGELTLKDFQKSPVMSPNKKDTKEKGKRTTGNLAPTQLVKEFGTVPRHSEPPESPPNPTIKVMYDQRVDLPLSAH